MDKNVLIEYADMKMEIKDLRRRIEDKQNRIDKLHTTVMSDTVTMGKKGRERITRNRKGDWNTRRHHNQNGETAMAREESEAS